jgi:hypothetical protein
VGVPPWGGVVVGAPMLVASVCWLGVLLFVRVGRGVITRW